MTQEKPRSVLKSDVLALLQKIFGLKNVFILFTAFYVACLCHSWELISSFNLHIRLLHVSMWLIKLMMAKNLSAQDLQAGTLFDKRLQRNYYIK